MCKYVLCVHVVGVLDCVPICVCVCMCMCVYVCECTCVCVRVCIYVVCLYLSARLSVSMRAHFCSSAEFEDKDVRHYFLSF